MSQAQKSQVYQERKRIETVRTVAAILREENSQADDVSSITGTIPQGQGQITNGQNNPNASLSGNTRSLNQVTLENIGQAFNRQCLNAIKSGISKIKGTSDPLKLLVGGMKYCTVEQNWIAMQIHVTLMM
jgi:hypothetical protein